MAEIYSEAPCPPWRRRHPVLFWLGLILLAWLAFTIAAAVYGAAKPGGALSGPYLGVVNIEGTISDPKPVLEWIEQLGGDANAVGVLVCIDSPGGEVTPSEEIYSALKRLGETRPLVASLGSTAASGGYMAAVAAAEIVAYPTTITGSIGVLMELGNYRELLDMLGVSYEYLATGDLKTAGSPFQQLTDKQRIYLMGIIENLYARFTEIVRSNRDLSDEQFAQLADGRAVTGQQALALGLVDRLGDKADALDVLRARVGVEEQLPLLEGPEEDTYSLLRSLLSLAGFAETGGFIERLAGQAKEPRGARFYYF